jgi:RHS repeat-associated protein
VGVTYLRGLNIDEPFIRQGSSEEYYHADALGSILALSDQSGTVQTTYQYEAFGKTTITGPSTNPFQYTGRENDGTGVYYYCARYYNFSLRRFMSEDPIGLLAGINKYVYADNNPMFDGDPTGLLTDKQIQDIAEFLTAIADSVSFGLGPIARKYTDLDSWISQCSGSYQGGEIVGLISGLLRLDYATAAKKLPFIITKGASELDRALAISGARNALKRAYRFGQFPNWGMKSVSKIIEETGGNPALIIEKATKTNPLANAAAANAAIGSTINLSSSKCGCE